MEPKYLIIILLSSLLNLYSQSEDAIIFTANQEFLSRIYVLKMDGTVHNFFQYEFYRFVDMEVVNNELYACDAFAPRMYKVDPSTGDLELVIDDWSLFYFYGLSFDGTYFYVDEWDLNRYDINGGYNGTASFDETVYGSAWDGNYLWTLGDENIIKCWDITNWPVIVAIPDSNFSPPTDSCRGLWYDGEYFWTAESGSNVGKIYRFGRNGNIIQQWNEPAFSGWAACVVEDFFEPIPVELVSFSGKAVDGKVELKWITATETNNLGFEVHRIPRMEASNKKNWEIITFIEGKGTTSEPQVYSFTDNTVKTGTFFYRLKQSDNNGVFYYSDTIEVKVDKPVNFALYQNYPNPFNPSTRIRFNIPQDIQGKIHEVSLRVFDVLGNEVTTLVKDELPAGVYEIEFSVRKESIPVLPSGIYFYQFKVNSNNGGRGNYSETKKMLLLR